MTNRSGLISNHTISRSDHIISRGHEVICTEARALWILGEALGPEFVHACETILATSRQVVLTGIGKSGHIARKLAATFAGTGTPAIFIHPSEALHGDLGSMVTGDILLVLSHSGNSPELRGIMTYARAQSIPVIGMASGRCSHVIAYADIGLILPDLPQACSANFAPTTSTALQLALGDALALAVMDMRGVSRAFLRAIHPGGALGRSITPVIEVMHGPEALPLVNLNTSMRETLSVMTMGRFGLAGVIDADGSLAGVITDGDLRRKFASLTTATASTVMTPHPIVIPASMIVRDALTRLHANAITAAFVVAGDGDAHQPPIGIVHLHDLLRLEMD